MCNRMQKDNLLEIKKIKYQEYEITFFERALKAIVNLNLNSIVPLIDMMIIG